MRKEKYEKFIQNGVFRHLINVTSKFHILMMWAGKHCKRCGLPFIPQPIWGDNFPSATHYPTKEICGFCVYDMDAYEHSQIEDPTSEWGGFEY